MQRHRKVLSVILFLEMRCSLNNSATLRPSDTSRRSVSRPICRKHITDKDSHYWPSNNIGWRQRRFASQSNWIQKCCDVTCSCNASMVTTLLAKTSHLEELADQALANPRDGDLLFLIGAFLYADGEGDRAVRFLQKAYELADPEGGFLTPLLVPAAPADAKVAELDT